MNIFYDMSKYPIYNADSIDPYKTISEENSTILLDLLEESVNQTEKIQKDYALLAEKHANLMEEYNKLAKISERLDEMYDSANLDAIIKGKYIDDHYDWDDYMEYLKSLKSNPKYKKYLSEIEMLLANYCEDE